MIKNKSITFLGAIILGLIVFFFFFKNEKITHPQKSMEEIYIDKVSVPIMDDFQDSIYQKLLQLTIQDSSSIQVTFKELFGLNAKNIFSVDKAILDYSFPCKDFPDASILSELGYCQYILIEDERDSLYFFRGSCEYDLLNFSESFDKTWFQLENPVEKNLINDTLLIKNVTWTDSTNMIFIEPLIHNNFKNDCQSFVNR